MKLSRFFVVSLFTTIICLPTFDVESKENFCQLATCGAKKIQPFSSDSMGISFESSLLKISTTQIPCEAGLFVEN